MTESRRIPPPKHLDLAGRRLWKRVTPDYKLRPDELVLLESACKTLDLITDLEDAVRGEPLTVAGSMGQLREHPLLSEVRQQRALLGRLFAQLKLPDEDTSRSDVRSVQARAAARARWSRPGA